MGERKLLVLSSSFIMAIWIILVKMHPSPDTFSIDVTNQFTYGDTKAPIHLILFEEFACPLCISFYKEAIPLIEKNYVKEGKVKITVIPLAFLHDSLPACTLLLSIQKLAPANLKAFYEFLFSLSYEELISFSFRDFVSGFLEQNQNLPAPQILKCLRDYSFEEEIEHNLSLAQTIYPGDIRVPIVLLNGKLVKNPDLKTLSKAIDEAL